jgi:tRNA pseudouridine55 synthase
VDGLLVVDKPQGLTSHDIVDAVRRATGEKRVGHAGTLDPMATGVLVLLLGRATRLARFYAASTKTYVAGIRLGTSTDTYDAEGTALPSTGPVPGPDTTVLAESLRRFTGTFAQVPPPYSAKKVEGVRAYDLARRDRPVVLAPVTVTVHDLEVLARDGDAVELRITCSAGFYVRALAHDLGQLLGCGAHLASLRRTASGQLGLDRAVRLEDVAAPAGLAAEHVLPLARMLDWLPGAVVTAEGVPLVAHGTPVPPGGVDRWEGQPPETEAAVRLLSPSGELLAVADRGRRGRALQPTVVLA